MKIFSLLSGVGLCLLPTVFEIQSQFQTPSRTLITSLLPSTGLVDGGAIKGLDQVIGLANAFKATLSTDQLAQLQLPYSKTNAVKWSNFPGNSVPAPGG